MEGPIEKHMKAEQSELEVQMENRFYWEDNLSKLCAEGVVRNLMNMLHCSRAESDSFWEMATMSVQETQFVLKDLFNNKKVPNGVIKRKFRSWFNWEMPMDPAKEVQFCNNIKIEAILFLMCEAISKGTFGNWISCDYFSTGPTCNSQSCGCCLEKDGYWLWV